MMREETPKKKAKLKPKAPEKCWEKSPMYRNVSCQREKGHEGHHSFRTSWE